MLEVKVTESATSQFEEGDGGINFDGVVYVSNARNTVLQGVMLKGFNKENDLQEGDIFTTLSVKGRKQKVISAKKIITKPDSEDPNKTFSYYDKYEEDLLVNEMEASKKANPLGKPTVNLRSVEVFVPFYCTHAQIDKFEKDDKGKPTGKKETLTYTPNKVILVGMSVGKLYFPQSTSSVSDALKKAQNKGIKKAGDKGMLETHIIQYSYGDIDDVSPIAEESKAFQKEIAELRKNKNLVEELFSDLLPIPYSQWYEETQGIRYYTSAEKKKAADNGIKLDYTLVKSSVSETTEEEDLPF